MREYIKNTQLELIDLTADNSIWFDCGMAEDLQKASNFIRETESNQKQKIGCIEEIAFMNNYISASQLNRITDKMPLNNYRYYLEKLLKDKNL